MDRVFLSYYENELTHLRELAREFGRMNANAHKLSLDAPECPDPYVERLLEGVAFLGARTHQKLDREGSRHALRLLDALYPDLSAPAPAMGLARLTPGPQVEAMLDGHTVERGTPLVAGLREGLSTRAVYTTAQDVDLWPVRIKDVAYLPDRGSLKSAGASDAILGQAESAIRIVIERTKPVPFQELSLDRIDLHLGSDTNGHTLFDAIFGAGLGAVARPLEKSAPFRAAGAPAMVGLADDEGLLPRVRPSFEGYRLLREYFLMPERFHYARLSGLQDAVRRASGSAIEVLILLEGSQADLTRIKTQDVGLFVTPIVNLFERECNIVELNARRASHVVHVDRTRPRDFEVYHLLRVEDAEQEGPSAELHHLHSADPQSKTNFVYATDRRPRRPTNDELDAKQWRSTGYRGDDLMISVARPKAMSETRDVRRLDIRALCTNRDIPILDDLPRLSMQSGDPVTEVKLLQALRLPRPSLSSHIPYQSLQKGQAMDDVSWRWIAQLSLAQLSVSNGGADVVRSLLSLYADRGDPAVALHGRSIAGVEMTSVIDRVARPGPVCFASGMEITLNVDTSPLSGSSRLLLSAILSKHFAREAAINSFVRTRTWLISEQKEVTWPSIVGNRALI